MPNDDLTGKTVTLDLTKLPKVPADNDTFVATANALQIIDDTSYSIAAEMIQRSLQWDADVDAFFENGREAAHASWKWFTGNIATFKAKRNVRGILEPRMKAFKKKQEAESATREREQARIAEEARQKAEQEARRIQAEADERAAELRRQGEMRAAREVVATAAEQATSVVEQADSLAELGTIEPAPAKLAGVSDSRPWVGEVVDMRALCKAIGDGTIPLTWSTPVRGSTIEMLPLVVIDQSVLNHIAKRMGKEDIGLAGCIGFRSVQLRFSKSVAKTQEDEW